MLFDCPSFTFRIVYKKRQHVYLTILLWVFLFSFSWKHRSRINLQEQAANVSFIFTFLCLLSPHVLCMPMDICTHKRIHSEMHKHFFGGCPYLQLSLNDIALLTNYLQILLMGGREYFFFPLCLCTHRISFFSLVNSFFSIFKHLLSYFLSCVQLWKGSERVAWWAPGTQPRSTNHIL